jgi:hypothetical protein
MRPVKSDGFHRERERHSWDAEGGGSSANKSGTAEDYDIHAFVSCSSLPEMKAFFFTGEEKKEEF